MAKQRKRLMLDVPDSSYQRALEIFAARSGYSSASVAMQKILDKVLAKELSELEPEKPDEPKKPKR